MASNERDHLGGESIRRTKPGHWPLRRDVLDLRCTRIGRKAGVALAALACTAASLITSPAQAATPSRGTLYLSTLPGSLYRAAYVYDSAHVLSVSRPVKIAELARGGSVRVLPNGNVVVVGAGIVSLFDERHHQISRVSSQSNANTAVMDPDGPRLWAGWKDTALSVVPLNPLADGTPHGVSGDDSVATMLAFTPSNGVFYSTGGEFENGNMGHINLSTYATTRIAASAFATGIVFDPFSSCLISAGLGHARQVDPAAPSVILSQRDDSGSGESYLVLEPTGAGHLLGTRGGSNPGVVLIDYSTSARIGDASSILREVSIPGISDLSGALGLDQDLIYRDGLEPISISP